MSDVPGTSHDTSSADAGAEQERRRLHNVRNQLSIIIGYCELLLNDVPQADRKHADLQEIRKAGQIAMELLQDPPAHS